MEERIFIERDHLRDLTRVWFEKRDSRSRFNISMDENGYLVEKQVQVCSRNDLKPFLEIPTDAFNSVMKAVFIQLEREGFRLDSDSINEGKLVQMEKHLSDVKEHKSDLKNILDKIIKKLPE